MSLLVIKLTEEKVGLSYLHNRLFQVDFDTNSLQGGVTFACPRYKNARTEHAHDPTRVEPSDGILPLETVLGNLELER